MTADVDYAVSRGRLEFALNHFIKGGTHTSTLIVAIEDFIDARVASNQQPPVTVGYDGWDMQTK